MIMIRKKRSLSTVLALALITLAAFCPEQVTSISDQQQQQTPKATSENQPQPQPQPQAQQQQQQKQTPASQPQSTSPLSQLDQPQPQSTTDSTTKTVPQMTSNTKSSTIAQQTTQQPSTFTTTGGRNNNKQQQQTTGRHNTSSVGKARKPTSRQHGNDVRTVAATSSVTQDQQQEVARLAQLYGNTPPLFITPTRDFYIDVARHSLGFKLTTIQAIDTDGDKIEYSLQPAKFLDASPYFSINATSGELRLISKRILEPKALELIDAGNGESQDDPAPFQVEEQEQQKQLQQHEQHYQQQPDTPPSYLYFLNVVAWDGHYPSVVELKIHVSNLTHFGTNSPVRLTPEGGHRGAESLMRAKTGEFLSNLYSSAPLSQRQLAAINNSTVVLPNFVNPNLLSGPFDGSSQRVHSGESSVSLQAPTIRPGQQLDQDPRQQQQQQPIVDSNDLETPDRSLLTTVPAPNPLQQQQPSQILGQQPGADMGDKRPASLLVQQPMLLSIITIIFSCLIIAFVMLVFIVPISVKRLKKRLKTMERQHEQLSQKASNGGSSIAGSCLSHVGSLTTTNSMTTNGGGSTMGDGSRGPLSSLSQFTLASSDRSCAILPPINRQHHHHHDQQQQQHHAAINGQHQAHFRRANPLGRQSSLDSAITNQAENSYNSSQFTCNQLSSAESYLAAAQHHHHRNMVIMMMDSNGTQEPPDIHHHGGVNRGAQQITCLTTDQQQQLTTSNNGLNRINNGAIVNPVYLHQLNTTGNNGPNKAAPDNIYCPIDDEFYSTINTDSSTLVDEEIATHNYNLYTRQRDGNNNNNVLSHQTSQTVAPSQTPGHNQIGSLVGQTTGFRNYTASGSAQPMSFVRDQLVRDTGSPTQSTSSSRSSTRSLARFLSLPARHWSHQQHNSLETTPTKGSSNSSKRKGSGLFDELDFDFNATNTASELRNDRADTGLPQAPPAQPAIVEQQLAKTIARADRIGHEQQVRHKRNINHHHQDHQSSQGATGDRWEIERHKLRFLNILDEGQFGLVWRCKLKVDDTPTAHTIDRRGFNHDTKELTVAVKTLKSFAAKDVREREELLAEIEIMKLVCNHPNVVRILHCCTRDIGPTRPILLIMEHVELGKLQSFLERSRTNHQYATLSGQYKNNSLQFTSNSGGVILGRDYRTMAGSIASTSSIIDGDCGDEVASIEQVSSQPAQMELPSGQQQHSSSASMMTLNNNSTHNTITTTNDNQLTSRDLIKFIYHVAKGMEHVSSNCIVHRDLASRNILISSQRVCKIGDFGMARHMESMGDVYERHSRNTKVPVRWMAPEVLLENSFTTKSDVFSFGILMWEIVTLGSTPYRHLKTDQIIQAVARNGERPEKPEYCHELLYNIMSCCWSHDPNKRPSFQELVAQLDGLLMSTEEYIQLDQYPDHNYYNIPQTAAPFELL